MNHEEAFKWLQRAASKGNVEAQYLLGKNLYLNKKRYGEAVCWLEKAANQGHEEAIYTLGEYYVLGPFASSTFEEAIEWLSKPAINNNPDAAYLLAQAYEYKERHEYKLEHPFFDCIDVVDLDEKYNTYSNDIIEFKPSQKVFKLYEKALHLHEEKASFGSWKSAIEVARMYFYGVGCEVNKEKAFDYYYRLASQEKGMPDGECCEFYRQKAIIHLAKMYELGEGCKQNLDKCNELIQKYEIDKEWFNNFKI